ncbi:alpha/beta hydrolase fold domain-containing protein [Methanobrevibacter sp.]
MSEISFITKIANSILKFTKPDYMDSSNKTKDFLSEKSKKESKPFKAFFKSFKFNEMDVFHYGDESSKNTILFMHGGAYVNDVNMQHHLFCLKLAKKLNAHVLTPVYLLAPNHTAVETYKLMSDLYRQLLQKNTKIIFMGDSAGGGFILSFAQYLNTINLTQPENIVVFSPWVDISMVNSPYDNENDPILGEIGLRELGKSWAGDLDTQDFRVSPLYGNNANLAKTLIFVGDNEIFYKDILKYCDCLKDDGVDFRLIVGEGLFHIYPLFPIPEAKNAFREIEKELLD